MSAILQEKVPVATLPLTLKPLAPRPVGPAPATAPAVAAKTILIVEDEPLLRHLVVAVLKREGHQILVAVDGTEGAAVFAREAKNIDLLFTDVSLPGLRGPDLAHLAMRTRPDLKVLFASGSIQFEDQDTVDFLERTGILIKPFTTEQLVKAVRAILAA